MSPLGKDWSSERYQWMERKGWCPSLDRIPVPEPHWSKDIQLLPSQMDDDWAICSRDNPDAHILVEEGADSFVFDLEEVR